ncbi:Formyltransferase [Gonapodya prolifera JEL478]|uniref:Methionyl-tRNA formyltransferase, mitochondrial n=1 Tax=Gonapodya prolifera (strain JEL478) TaxID=1344416 RepID=A0A139API5_GONPJ|nr:Formyltransferase [Gonapodya prolifera JEL478]|eukprot:KXS18660.1 Formyltransferase [Gonapodya prolifera JEL478]
MGSDEFSLPSLQKLAAESTVSELEVVVPPSLDVTNPVRSFAKSSGIPVHIAPPKTLKGWTSPISRDGNRQFDLAVVVSFGYFLPLELIASFQHGAVNVHPSLLPKYRGAAPIQHALLHGDTETGVSIIEMHPTRWDAGRILRQSRLMIPASSFFCDLRDQLADLGAVNLVETLRYLEGHKLRALAALIQDESRASKAPKVTKSLARINWTTMTRNHVFNMYRAFGHQEPPFTTFNGHDVQIINIVNPNELDGLQGLPAVDSFVEGSIIYQKTHKMVLARCSDGWLGLRVLRPQYKKDMSATDFANGYKLRSGNHVFL